MPRPPKPPWITDNELAEAARRALGRGGGDPAALVSDAVNAAEAHFRAYDWLYDHMVPQLMTLATERAVAAGLHILDAVLEPATGDEHKALSVLAADKADMYFEAHHHIIDSLDGDLDMAISHGTRAALRSHLHFRDARTSTANTARSRTERRYKPPAPTWAGRLGHRLRRSIGQHRDINETDETDETDD